MQGFVLLRRCDGQYVAPSGSRHSYVKDIRSARIYKTEQDARNDCRLDSEDVRSVQSQFYNW